MKYLYGASIKGIQKYIFNTTSLKDIIGASEIVEDICTEKYKKYINNETNKIVAAAGNIRLTSEKMNSFEKIVNDFPLDIKKIAPDLRLVQAIVKVEGDLTNKEWRNLNNLLKEQRNRIPNPPGITLQAIKRSSKTGRPAIKKIGSDYLDRATFEKQNASKMNNVNKKIYNGSDYKFPKMFNRIIHPEESEWLGLIHADGNNLGKKIMQVIDEGNSLDEFSNNLNKATIKAAKDTFKEVILTPLEKGNIEIKENYFPFRPIILGGDDLTVICRADLAIDYTRIFLEKFEKCTKDIVEEKLTACAGITYIKHKYPFHYGITLTEELCEEAKKVSKNINDNGVPASLAFHKIKSTFNINYSDIKNRVLYAKNSDVKFNYGPYLINTKNNTIPEISELIDMQDKIKDKGPIKSALRRWLSELHKDRNSAQQILDRVKEIYPENYNKLRLDNIIDKNNKTIVYDVLSLLSLEKGE